MTWWRATASRPARHFAPLRLLRTPPAGCAVTRRVRRRPGGGPCAPGGVRQHRRVLVTPTSRAALAEEIVELVAARPGRVRLVLDGPAPARPGELAAEVATALRARGRATVVVDAADFLRPASVRLEQGRTDPDALLDGWLDDAALRREVLDPAAPDGSGQVLPRLWNTRTDRAYRDGYTALPADGVRGAARRAAAGPRPARRVRGALPDERGRPDAHLPEDAGGPCPPTSGTTATRPAAEADLLVLADHPDRPAVQRSP